MTVSAANVPANTGFSTEDKEYVFSSILVVEMIPRFDKAFRKDCIGTARISCLYIAGNCIAAI